MAGDARPARIAHVDALDGARGLAVAGVLVFHGGHLLGGYLGVDFFFVLSGFLITSLLLAEANRTGSVGLGGFWARRARRLLPALAVLMVGIAIYSWAFAKPTELSQIRGDALATLAYSANWREVFSHLNYFAIFATPSPLNHTWSLAIEEQFYVLWPLLFVGLLTRFKAGTAKAVLATSLVLAAVSTALMIALYSPTNVARAYYGTDTRATAILLGAALAAWLAIHGPTKVRSRRVALEAVGIAGAIFLAIAWTRLGGQSERLYRGGFLLCGLAATAVIAAAVHPEPGPVSRVLSFKPLCALGLISYGLYLYHWPLDVFLSSHRVGLSGWPLFAVQTAVALAVAIVSYRVVEQPIRHGALDAVQWRKLVPSGAVVLVAALVASTAGAQAASTAIPVSILGNPEAIAAFKYKNAPPGSTRVLVVGNSVALTLGQSFASLHTKPPLVVYNGGLPGCTFPPEITGQTLTMSDGQVIKETACDPAWEGGVVARFHPDIVFWIVSDPGGVPGRYRGKPIAPCEPAYNALYRRSLTKEISILRTGGTKVVLATSAYTRNIAHIDDHATDCENADRRAVATATHTQIIDLFSYVCPGGKCLAKMNGVTLRPDGLHYAGPGGKLIARWLLSQVR